MKKIILFSLAVLLLFFASHNVAAKTLPQAKKTKSTSQKSVANTIYISPRLRADHKALLVSFSNLQNAKEVSYMLIYQTNGQEEGAGGSLNLHGQTTDSRELLFGTCSKNVCRYHSNITNMKFEVTTKLTSGKTTIKRYRIKV